MSSYGGSVHLRRRDAGLRERSMGVDSPLWRLDWLLALAVAGLVGLGSLLVWSATRQRMLDADLDPTAFLKRHLINAAIGLALASVAALVDYRSLRAYAPVIYVLSCLGLIAVLSPLGKTINGAHSWIVLGGGFQVQPSEVAKVALVVGMAMLLAEQRDGEDGPRDGDVVMVLLLAAVPMALVMLQPDLGTVLVLVFIVLGVLALSGAPARWIVGLIAAGALVSVAAVQLGVLDDYQVDRFAAFANPALDPQGVGYNTNQARIAIGSGGLDGKGLFQGTQTNGRFIPEQQTDFIFTVAGEELGLLGGSLLLGLLGVVLWRGLRIASRSKDAFGRLVAAGVVCWFAFQSFVNVGMTLGIMPVTGLPLPFVSYGGSAMFANLVAVGLLQNVHLRSRDL
ncbi:MAG: rod shape-determining protein RodA [Frankiales bacterium]|nr:rod shape-determining protein RodA [Frankiales bacterium]